MNEQTNEPQWVPEDRAQAYFLFGIPGVPFSSVRVPLLDDERAAAELIAKALRAAKWTQEKYRATFPDAAREDRPQQRPAGQQRPQGRPQGRSQGQQGGTGYFCPNHNVEVRKTDAKYDRDGDRYYHPLHESDRYWNNGREVKNHNLYLRQLVDSHGRAVQSDDAQYDGGGYGDDDPDMPF